MKIFDKLNDDNEDEEVELKPDTRLKDEVAARTQDQGSSSTSTDDESESLLPGAVGGSDTTSDRGRVSSSTKTDGDLEEQIKTVIEQNERIIELLETISSVSSGSTNRSSDGKDELW